MAVWFNPNYETEFSDVRIVFRDNFRAEFENCFMVEFIVFNDNLEMC